MNFQFSKFTCFISNFKSKAPNFNFLHNYLIFLFIFLLPTQFGKHFFLEFSYLRGIRVDYLAPTIYVTDLLIVVLVIANFRKIFSFFLRNKVATLIFLLSINTYFALSKPIAIYRFVKIIEFFAVIALLKNAKMSEKALLLSLLISSVFQGVLVFFQLISKRSIGGLFYYFGERYINLSMPGIAKASLDGVEILRPYGTFSHPNSLAGFYLVLYFFILTKIKSDKLLFWKYLSLFIFSLLIFFSFSKAAILTYLIINTLYLIRNTRFKCKPCFIAKIVIPLVLGLVFIRAKTDPQTLDKRFELISNSIQVIKNNLLMGVGIGNYLLAQNNFNTRYYNFLNQPVHNIFLLAISEVGIPLVFFSIIIYRKAIRFMLTSKIRYVIFALVLTGLFDHYWLTLQQNFILIAFLVGSNFEKELDEEILVLPKKGSNF